MAPMVYTATMLHCPQCRSTGQLVTSRWCPFQCCHGWVQERSLYQLRAVFKIDGTSLDEEWRRLLQSPTLQWHTLTIHAPVYLQVASLTIQVMWTPVLHHQLQWQGGHLSPNRITTNHQGWIKKSRAVVTEPGGWNFPIGLAVPAEAEMFQQLQLTCRTALTPGRLEDGCLLLSVKVRKARDDVTRSFLIHVWLRGSTQCCVPKIVHQQKYHIQALLHFREVLTLAEAQCSHPTCVGRRAKILVSCKRRRQSADTTVTPAKYARTGSSADPPPNILSGLYRQVMEKVSAESSTEHLRTAGLSDAVGMLSFGQQGKPFVFPWTQDCRVRVKGGVAGL